MEHLSFHNRLQVYGHRLSKSEQKIAAYITEHPEQARRASSRELALCTGTSNSTLTRFCQKLDYRNFIEFQTLLSAESAPPKIPGQILPKIAHYYSAVLSAASELVNADSLNSFVSRIHQANKIPVNFNYFGHR